jgi:DNA polymerase-3 subunit delta
MGSNGQPEPSDKEMLIFLYGADVFRSREKINALKNKYLQKNSSGAGLSVLDFAQANISLQDLKEKISYQGMFSTKSLTIANNALLNLPVEKQKEILEYLKSNKGLANDEDTVVVFHESGEPKKSTSLFKYLAANSKKQEFALLSGAQLTNWAIAKTKELEPKTQYSRDALDLLLSSTGSDLFLLNNEISKLVNYKNEGIVSKEDVDLLVKSKIDSTMFETIEALSSGNKSRALKLFHEQLEKGEDPFYVLSMYVYQLRTLLKIGDFFWQGMTNAPQIAQAAKLHPYVVQKSLSQVRALGEGKIRAIFDQLVEIDSAAKTGKTDLILALDTFIVSL